MAAVSAGRGSPAGVASSSRIIALAFAFEVCKLLKMSMIASLVLREI